jgi:hypothetical protein
MNESFWWPAVAICFDDRIAATTDRRALMTTLSAGATTGLLVSLMAMTAPRHHRPEPTMPAEAKQAEQSMPYSPLLVQRSQPATQTDASRTSAGDR